PELGDTRFPENVPPDCHRPAPGELVVAGPEASGDHAVPDASLQRPEVGGVWQVPAVAGRHSRPRLGHRPGPGPPPPRGAPARGGLGQRAGQCAQPAAGHSAVGVREGEDLGLWTGRGDSSEQVIDLLAGVWIALAGYDQAGGRRYDARGYIAGAAGDDEQFVV